MTPSEARPGDPGLDVVARVRDALASAPEFLSGSRRGFTWWPAAFSQRVHAGGPVALADGPAWPVRAELLLLRGVRGSARAFAVLSHWNATRPGLSGLRWNGEERTVSLCAGVLARAGAEAGAASRLLSAALLQLADAARDGDALAAELLGARAVSAPPGRAPRTEPDALLEAWRRFAAAGAPPGPFAGERLVRAAAQSSPPWVRVQVDATGLHAEVPCALEGEKPPGSAPGEGVALVHLLTAQPHPVLGAGVLAALSLPPAAEPVAERAVSTAALLNEAEAREPVPFDALGAWCVHRDAGLAFALFWPALLDEPGILAELAGTLARRALWARELLARVAGLRDAPPV